METIGVLLYTANRLDKRLQNICQEQLLNSLDGSTELVSVSVNGPCDIGRNIEVSFKHDRHALNSMRQQLVGLEKMESDYVFFADDDVFYNPTHFYFNKRRGRIWYNYNVWTLDMNTGRTYFWLNKVTSAVSGYRKYLIEDIKNKLKLSYRERMRVIAEPTRTGSMEYFSTYPLIDLKHDNNFSKKAVTKSGLQDLFKFTPKCYYSGYHIPYYGTVVPCDEIEYLQRALRKWKS